MNEELYGTEKNISPSNKKRRLPVFAVVALIISGLSVLLYVAFMLSESFADFFNRYISSVLRAVLAYATAWVPFSLGEFILILSPLLIAAAAIYGSKKYVDSWRDVFIYCSTLISVVALVFSTFILGFAPAYRGSRLDEKLGIDKQEVSADELYSTAVILSESINREKEGVVYNRRTNFSVMPYGLGDMNDKLLDAYDLTCDKYSFVQRLDSRLKPVMLSELMSYTHITGVYSFFTGEANINVAFPDYTIPFTAAHELAHQRGIARENEANFVAFLVCMESDDPYIRYCAYVNMMEYVMNSLYAASPDYYGSFYGTLDSKIIYEYRANSAFFEKYRENVAADVSSAVNNNYLQSQGQTEGTRSYGLVVDLTVAYYKNQQNG